MLKKYDIIIIGGGASGLFAAAKAGEKGLDTLVIEKNDKLGKKLYITGKGRCNVTNNCDNEEFLKNVPTNSRFLYSSINSFSCSDTMEFFENMGVKLKTERGNRVFPCSDQSSEIVHCLENACNKANIKIIKNCLCEDIIVENGCVKGVLTNLGSFFSDNVLLCTGGKSYSVTGSDGFGYTLAQKYGHNIIAPKGSLVPIETKEKYATKMMGLSLKNVTLTIIDKKTNKAVYKDMGEMLFTHFGVSGPLVLSASSFINPSQEYDLFIDFKPALDNQTLDKRILREINNNINKDFSNIIRSLLPAKAVGVFIQLCDYPDDLKANQVTKEQRLQLINHLKSFKLTFKKFRPIDEAIITSGGVDVKQINPKTMESKLVKGLYFCGEIIDTDAFTGGFNLQIAFSTANSAINSIW